MISCSLTTLGDFWLIQLAHKAFLLNSSFPSKALTGECLYRQVACVHSLPVYKGTKRRKGDPVLEYKKMLQIPPLSTSCCIYLSDHHCFSKGWPPRGSSPVSNSSGFQVGQQGQRKIARSHTPSFKHEAKRFLFPDTQLQRSKRKQKTHI